MSFSTSSKNIVAKVSRAHGIRGEIFIIFLSPSFDLFFFEHQTQLNLFFPERGVIQTYSILYFRSHKNGAIVALKEISNRNEAELLKGAQVVIPSSDFISKPGENIFLAELEGFKVKNESGEIIGIIEDFSIQPGSDLIIVRSNKDKIYEIPLVSAFIIKLDVGTKELIMKLPEGLVD